MKFIILGTSEFTIACAKALLKGNALISALISMSVETRPLNAADIKSFAEEHHIDYVELSDINSAESLAFLRKKAPDYILSTWPKLIGSEALAVPKYFVIGTHPTDLPRNRGRHPLHWIVDLGIRKTSLSFFVMDEGVDSGDILLQVPIAVDECDSIVDLNEKVIEAGGMGIQKLLPRLADRNMHPKKQRHDEASYWRKRTPFDVIIDLRMSSSNILRIIRSFIPPYPSAKLVFRDHAIKIISGKIVTDCRPFEIVAQMEPGKILTTDDYSITVKSADEIIQLVSNTFLPHEIHEARYIHPPAKYFIEFGEVLLATIDT